MLSKYRRKHQNLRGNRSLSTKDLSEVRERDLSVCCVRIVRAYRCEVHFNCGLPRVLAGNEFSVMQRVSSLNAIYQVRENSFFPFSHEVITNKVNSYTCRMH